VNRENDLDILVPALSEALSRWREWQKGKSFLGSYPPGESVLTLLISTES